MSELPEKVPPTEAAHAMHRSNSWEVLDAPPNEAPPPYAEVEKPKVYSPGCVQATRGYLITRDWRNNLTVFEGLQQERPLYKIKNQYTFLNNQPDVIVTRNDGAPVGVCSIRRSLLAKCQLDCYADEGRTQLLASGQRDGIAHRYVFELTQGVRSKRFTWNPTTLLGLGWSYGLLDDSGKLVANFENETFSMWTCGRLYVHDPPDASLLDIVILMWSVLREKRRREHSIAVAASSRRSLR